MANRGAKSKEYRLQVTSVKQWLKELQFDGLMCVEVGLLFSQLRIAAFLNSIYLLTFRCIAVGLAPAK